MIAPVITDAAGRQWKVYDYAVYVGKTQRYPVGKGQYRGFVPVDGGARRTVLMLQADRRDDGAERLQSLPWLARYRFAGMRIL